MSPASKPIGVGIVGCGEIAQLMHLPILHELPDFRIAALCDLSPSVLAHLGAQYGVAARYGDYRALLADPAVEAVAICSFDHAPAVEAALRAGKHVLVEKPLGFTAAEARPLVALAEASPLVAMVGYMKLYDPGYRLGVERIRAIGRPKMIHVHDFAGRFDRYQSLHSQMRGTDIEPAVLAAGRAEVEARVRAMLGAGRAAYHDLYMTLLMLGSHDLAVMRGAFGVPEAVRYAAAPGATHVLALLDLPDGVPAMLEIAFGAQYEWWDEWIAVYGERDEVRIEFQNPYVRNTAATVRVKEAAGQGPCERTLFGTPDTAFRRQWLHFAACLRDGAVPETPLADGLADLELAEAIMRALPEKRA